MTPKPWSYSALDRFKTCPRQYYEVSVAKSVQESQSEQLIWGNKVHKAFENYIKLDAPLPDYLQEHEPFMSDLRNREGLVSAEQKVALNRKVKPCTYFEKDVWFRGVIDYCNIHGDTAYVVDYKTGKQHHKIEQLASFALWIFAAHPEVETVSTDFYWTKTLNTTGEVWVRSQTPKMWGLFLPDLRQYAEAFKTDTWQPRQSGLCAGWCPVHDCEFWRPKR